jgi:SAM-dependent methyltransferase
MSEGFSADWLALREPYDATARSPALVDRLAAWRLARGALRVLDLGAGTGANLRRLAPALGGEQSWTLVELDPALITAGTERLAGTGVTWAYRGLDLARDLDRLEAERPDLISASALVDLVAEPWLARLATLRARTGAALHVVLTYDGRIAWNPPDPTDASVAELVNRHQRTDKGFGPALGPEAVPALQRLLAGAEGDLLVERSDWRLGPDDREIQSALLAGYAEAARCISPSLAAEIAAWRNRRARFVADGASRLTVGHLDLLFLPAGQASRA